MLRDCDVNLNISVVGRKWTLAMPSMIFITGTTGFVGDFLLEELLRIYPSKCKFVCLVRCERSTNALDRIRKNMLFYQIWKDEYQQRIIALQGDLAKSRFGLDVEIYDSLAHQIDIIFHCGATVNFVLPYNQLYGPNVCGTREIIYFSTHHPSSCIPIQYISTISVLSEDVDKEISIDETSPNRLLSGYAQSKWVAEKLISKASHVGVPVVIYRLGLICADSRTGACNPHDLYTMLFGGMAKMGCYPESAIHFRLNGLAVDFTAKSIVYLSGREKDVYGNIYHVMNPNNEIRFEDVIDGMRRCGIELKSVSNDEWKKKMNDGSSPVESVGELFSESGLREKSNVLSEKYCNAVCALLCPLFDKEYLSRWLGFIIHNIVRR
jgi:thioester reductase-like protein